jgi:type IV secretory pathway TraG/TraD family ATPase VirD4
VAATGSDLGIQQTDRRPSGISQLKPRLGQRAASAVNNHRARIAVGGISDLETTEYFSRLAGTAEFVQRSTRF